MQNLLVNRLVLNLRTFGNETAGGLADRRSAGPSSRLQPIQFAHQDQTESRILGNIGAPLDYDQWNGSQFDCDLPEIDGSVGPSGVIDSQAADLEHGTRDSGDVDQEMGERSSGVSLERVLVSKVGVSRDEILNLTFCGSDRTLNKLKTVATLKNTTRMGLSRRSAE